MKQRIWEIDALRGICIFGMIVIHFFYDLVDVYALVSWNYPDFIQFFFDWGGIIFLLISGVSATLGSRSVKRGLIVFACGMLCTAVTWAMAEMGMLAERIVIWFGILHCLGLCMLLWQLCKRMPAWLLAVLGIALIVAGFWLETQTADYPWLVWLGLRFPGFTSGDYFPLLPNFGYFLVGATLGRTLYRNKTTLLPKINSQAPVLRFLQFCGRHSLWIYLIHQPVLNGIFLVLGGIL